MMGSPGDVAPPISSPSQPEVLPEILIVTAGGLEHGGGIGRVIGYMVDGWTRPDAPRWRVVDTRGPRVDLAAPFRFLAALATIVAARPRRPLLHVHIAGRGSTVRKLIVGWLARLLGLRVVLHLHDYNYRAFCDALPGWAAARVAALFRGAALVVVLGRGDAELVQTRFGVAPARVAVMHNAVPAPSPPVAARPLSPRSGAPVHILFLGRLSERKGVP
ncbi:MAG: glycosyltransferase, partial [Alphaproteobacteria bacterium]|nr:glycosyltransferase [Alphaproteobacteria bacterium]